MRKYFLTAFVLAAMLVFATSGLALEKSVARMTDDSRTDGWNAAGTCTVLYYNFCTGWVWVLSQFAGNFTFGMCFDTCCGIDKPEEHSALLATWHYVFSGSPSGYGFTGTIDVSTTIEPEKCVGLNLASQVHLPISGWNLFTWGGVKVPDRFLVSVTTGFGGDIFLDPAGYAMDHPSAGPTGPQAGGLCYPLTRPNHSWDYGTVASPLCPPVPLFGPSVGGDAVQDAQLLWEAVLACTIGVEESSWGTIKNLYR